MGYNEAWEEDDKRRNGKQSQAKAKLPQLLLVQTSVKEKRKR